MIILTILLFVILAIAVYGVLSAIAAGVSFLWWFKDVIILGLVVWAIVKIIKRIKKK